jgi:Uma2 family endonuclease
MAGAPVGQIGLVVEELCTDDSFTPVTRRVIQFLRGGVPEVWLLDPETRSVSIYAPGTDLDVITEGDEEDGRDTLSRLRCRVADLVGPSSGR